MLLNIVKRFMRGMINIYFGSIKNQVKFLIKYKGFLASSLPTYDFSTLITTLAHNLIK